MLTESRQTTFDEFLNAFAEAVELAAGGEVDDALNVLAEAQRRAEQAAEQEGWAHGALLYRYEVAARVLEERYR
jgi:hypothetical protein